jgi:hypothetical protein
VKEDLSFAEKISMTKKYRSALVLFILFCLLSFYSYGTAMMDYFLLYPSRFIVGEKEFPQYHKLLEVAIFPITVFPFVVIIILNAILLWFRPAQVSKTLLWISMICLTLDFLSTVFFQAPWNMQLSQGKNIELMQKITDTNWGRVFLESAQVVIVFLLLKQFVFRHAIHKPH